MHEDHGEILQKPDLPDAFLAEVQLPGDVLYNIWSQLPLRDALRSMQVCKLWKTLLSEKYFWKIYIQKRFDLGIKTDLSDEGPMAQWSKPQTDECFFDDGYDDVSYVMRPFPSMWNCRVVHPFGLDPFTGDVRSLQGFCRSLEILTYLRSETSRLNIMSGNQCSASEDERPICVVLFPWHKEELPTPMELLDEIFHFHPTLYEDYANYPEYKGILRESKLFYHVRPNEYEDPDCVDEYEDDPHDVDVEPCLNSILGMVLPNEDEQWKFEASRTFYEWLQPIMCPSVTMYAGDNIFNPVAVFMLTHLAPGWVGGVLTAVHYVFE